MARKQTNQDELRKAIEKQAAALDPAQEQLVLSEFRNYEWNVEKILEIERHVNEGEFDPDFEKKALGERHQLVNENACLFTHIMQHLKGTAVEESALDAFM